MPVSYRFDTNIIVITMEGEYSNEEIYKVTQASLADPHFPNEPKLLIDLTGSVSLRDRSSENVNRVARYFGSVSAQSGK